MKTNQDWLKHFEANSKNRLEFEKDESRLTDAERERVTASIQAFQIGEASEGKLLKVKARAYAEKSGEEAYPDIINYLIREENRHSAYLGGFMRDHSIPVQKSNWTDGAFRFIRNIFNLETSIRVLVTAELVAVKYYAALASATESPSLKKISQRMLEEEAVHIRFQMQTIHKINALKHPIFAALSDILHGLLMAFTLVVVWHEHKQVLQTAYTFKEFFSGVYDLFRDAMDDGREAAFETLTLQALNHKEAV
ncbi:MAG: hypothetical protein ABL958_02150 [Bdellovibrionia bacterium]